MDPGIPSEPSSRSLKGKVALATGAGCLGDGIGKGRAISILLADDGCNVLCVDINEDWTSKAVDVITSKPGRGRALSFRADVTSEEDCKATVVFAIAQFGRLDVLINNVGDGGAPGTAVEVNGEVLKPGRRVRKKGRGRELGWRHCVFTKRRLPHEPLVFTERGTPEGSEPEYS